MEFPDRRLLPLGTQIFLDLHRGRPAMVFPEEKGMNGHEGCQHINPEPGQLGMNNRTSYSH